MTTTASPVTRPASRVLLHLLAGVVASATATSLVALAALGLGADPSFGPLQPVTYLTFAIAGTLAGIGGWVLIARRLRRPARTLAVLVPVLVALSLIPDVALLVTGFIPGTTPVGVIALMLMHPIVAAVAVLIGRRLAPVD